MSILQDPAPVLRRVADPVVQFGPKLRKLQQRMKRELRRAGGVGLAAPQIGVSVRFFIYDDHAGHVGAVANPEIAPADPTEITEDEGCLSVEAGALHLPTPRWRSVRLSGWDVAGRPFIFTTQSRHLARIFQHEVDHLDGILFTDRAERSSMQGSS